MAEEFKKQREVRFIIWSILLTFISIGPVNAQLLWKVSKENHSDSFLFGTHHLIPNNLVKDIHGLEEAYQASTLIIGEIDINEIHDLYKDYYKNDKFVRILPLGKSANIRNVTHSNFCDISVHTDPRSKRVIIISAIDNMIKGAAGQAIQNMNIRMGFKEEEGLMLVPPAF
mgnify:CR=1 FL=1